VYRQESVKAAFVLRFSGYVTWSGKDLPGDKFTIAVLGADDVVQDLQTLAADYKVHGRPVEVRRVNSLHSATMAQIVYVGTNRRGDPRYELAPLAGKGVLIITDAQGALDAGSVINLLVVDQRIRFEVSLNGARSQGLKISSDLLALAARVVE
jgi:hypothetical protein